LAGFESVGENASKKKKRLDNCAIAIVMVSDDGKWFVDNIEYGRWDIRETAVRILKNIREYRPLSIGIEKGALMNAVLPYLSDLMRKNNIYAHIAPLTHGNQDKNNRVVWALQGLFEHGRIILNEDHEWDEFKDEYLMFPTANVHDDLIDSLSMCSQMITTTYATDDDYEEEYEPIDIVSGI
jgi:predicted phage terminase large subunit-like protein